MNALICLCALLLVGCAEFETARPVAIADLADPKYLEHKVTVEGWIDSPHGTQNGNTYGARLYPSPAPYDLNLRPGAPGFVSAAVEAGTGANRCAVLGDYYTVKDFKLTAADGQTVIVAGDKVRVTGILNRAPIGDNYTYYLEKSTDIQKLAGAAQTPSP